MGSKDHVHTLLTAIGQKEDEIANLEFQTEAYRARTSHMQSRLLATLDELDKLRSSHKDELASLVRTKDRLNNKLDRYIDHVSAAEIERDDLKDAVIQLVERIETAQLSNNHIQWPYGRLRLTSLVAYSPNVDPFPIKQDSNNDSDEQLTAYASSIISALRAELDRERRAHEYTRKEAQHRISGLEAQVARREAELEAFVVHSDFLIDGQGSTVLPKSNQTHRRPGTKDVASSRNKEQFRSRMTQEEAIRILDVTSVKNKTLEGEVKYLRERLKMARLSTEPRSPSSEDVMPPKSRERPSLGIELSLPSVTSAAGGIGRTVDPLRQRSDSTSHPPQVPTTENNHPQTVAEHKIYAPVPFRPAPLNSIVDIDPRQRILADLDRQIALFTSEVNAFQAERDVIAQVPTREEVGKSRETGADTDRFDRVLLIEQECIRLTKSEGALRKGLEDATLAAQAREKKLEEEIFRLRSSNERCAQIEQFNNDLDGEQSMELETPLQYTLLLPASLRSRSDSPFIDPLTIPLPVSPATENPPLSSMQRASATSSSRTDNSDSHHLLVKMDDSKLQRVEQELCRVRDQLTEGEQALSRLRDVAEGIQRHLCRNSINAG